MFQHTRVPGHFHAWREEGGPARRDRGDAVHILGSLPLHRFKHTRSTRKNHTLLYSWRWRAGVGQKTTPHRGIPVHHWMGRNRPHKQHQETSLCTKYVLLIFVVIEISGSRWNLLMVHFPQSKEHNDYANVVHHIAIGVLCEKFSISAFFDEISCYRLQSSPDTWIWCPLSEFIIKHPVNLSDLLSSWGKYCLKHEVFQLDQLFTGGLGWIRRTTAEVLCEDLRGQGWLAMVTCSVQFKNWIYILKNLPFMSRNRILDMIPITFIWC